MSVLLSLFSLPAVISSALTFLTPFFSGGIAFLSWYFSEFWSGLKAIAANLSTLVVIATISLFTFFIGLDFNECKEVSTKPSTTINSPIDNNSSIWNPFNRGE